MTRVLYAYCTKPDVPNRIKALEVDLGWQPVMIITCSALQAALADMYPAVPVYRRDDFTATVSPIDATDLNSHNLIADFEYLRPFMGQALSMMERFALHDAFTYRERMRYFRKLIHEWGALLDSLKPDIAHFDETPHGVLWFVMYHLCKRRGIPTIWFVQTGFTGHNLLGDTIGGAPLGLLFSEASPASGLSTPDVPDALPQRVQSLRESENFGHWYMDKQTAFTESLNDSSWSSERSKILDKAKKIVRVRKWPLYARYVSHKLLAATTHRAWLKQQNEDDSFYHPPIKDSILTNEQVIQQLRYRSRYKRELATDYAQFVTPIELDDLAYVYFPLHFQPERTTNPEGGILRDQFIAIATIHDAMPEGWLLLVKEHPTEFNQNPVFATPKGRARTDYADLTELDNVRLVSTDMPSSTLVRNSRATATITGTACWEAAINGIPGIHMAHTWYEGFPNTHFMPAFEDLKGFFDQIESYRPAPREQEHRYLEKFIASSFHFEIGEQELPSGTFSSSEQAEGAVSAMSWWEGTLK